MKKRYLNGDMLDRDLFKDNCDMSNPLTLNSKSVCVWKTFEAKDPNQ